MTAELDSLKSLANAVTSLLADVNWDGVIQDDIERAIYLHAKSKNGLSV